MIDDVRAVWPGAKLIWATENGAEIGKRPNDDEQGWISAEGYLALQHDIAADTKARNRSRK